MRLQSDLRARPAAASQAWKLSCWGGALANLPPSAKDKSLLRFWPPALGEGRQPKAVWGCRELFLPGEGICSVGCWWVGNTFPEGRRCGEKRRWSLGLIKTWSAASWLLWLQDEGWSPENSLNFFLIPLFSEVHIHVLQVSDAVSVQNHLADNIHNLTTDLCSLSLPWEMCWNEKFYLPSLLMPNLSLIYPLPGQKHSKFLKFWGQIYLQDWLEESQASLNFFFCDNQ